MGPRTSLGCAIANMGQSLAREKFEGPAPLKAERHFCPPKFCRGHPCKISDYDITPASSHIPW